MGARVRTIEVDEATADVLEARAAECGVSVAELLADLAASDAASWSMAEEARLQVAGLRAISPNSTAAGRPSRPASRPFLTRRPSAG